MLSNISARTGALRLAISAVMLLSALAFAGAVDLSGAGATFPYPLYSKWFDVYGQNAGVRISYQSIGSGGGIKALQAQTVNFGASDAPLSDEELKSMPATVVQFPSVAGAVVISYNLPGIGKGLHLDAGTVSGIYLGTITNWSDPKLVALNPHTKLPNMPIVVAHRSDGSGTTYIFTHYLAAVSPAWAEKVGSGKSVNWPVGIGGKGNEGVSGVIKNSTGGIGYIELAYAAQNNLAYADLRNKAGKFVEPTIASTTAAAAGFLGAIKKDVRVSIVNAPGAKSYPIAGFTYLMLYKAQPDAEKGKALVTFLWWAIHDGQKYAEALLYAPLPESVAHLDENILESVTANGKSIQGK